MRSGRATASLSRSSHLLTCAISCSCGTVVSGAYPFSSSQDRNPGAYCSSGPGTIAFTTLLFGFPIMTTPFT